MVSHWCTTGTSHPHRREKTTQTASHTQRTDGCPLPLLTHTPAQPEVIPEFRKRQTTLERRIIREEEDRLPPSPFRIRDVLGPSHPSHSLAHYARQPFTYCFALEGDHPGIWLCFRPSRRRCPRYLGKCSYHGKLVTYFIYVLPINRACDMQMSRTVEFCPLSRDAWREPNRAANGLRCCRALETQGRDSRPFLPLLSAPGSNL